MITSNGEEFLAQLRAHSPDAERLLLARRVDRTVRSIVWSDARVMRILLDPCTTAALREAVSDAMLRHRARHLRASAVPRVTPVSGNPCAVYQPLR